MVAVRDYEDYPPVLRCALEDALKLRVGLDRTAFDALDGLNGELRAIVRWKARSAGRVSAKQAAAAEDALSVVSLAAATLAAMVIDNQVSPSKFTDITNYVDKLAIRLEPIVDRYGGLT